MRRESTQGVIERLLKDRPVLSTRDVVETARVSRQAAQKLLKALVDDGVLAIEGRARAAKYRRRVVDSPPRRRVDDSTGAARVDDSRVDDFRGAALLADFGSPYAGVPFRTAPRRVLLDVASAGSLYRLSARLLLSDVEADELTLDFTGVMDVSEEFLEEIFHVWARRHPTVRIEAANIPDALRPVCARFVPRGE